MIGLDIQWSGDEPTAEAWQINGEWDHRQFGSDEGLHRPIAIVHSAHAHAVAL
jgi:hypothetical protein